MRAILIDPVTRSIEEVDHDGENETSYQLLSVEGLRPVTLFQPVDLDDDNYLYLDEEGLLIAGLRCFQWITFPGSVFAGRGLILGVDEEGETVGTTITLERVRNCVQWTERVTTGVVRPGQMQPGPVEAGGMDFDFVFVGGAPVLDEEPYG